jgi:hypothetical protein
MTSSKRCRSKRLTASRKDVADKIKSGDILIVHNPDRNKEANAGCNSVHIALQQD